MPPNITHLLEVLFDGVGGAALVAFLTIWESRRREEKKSAPLPKVAKRMRLLMPLVGAVFVVFLSIGVLVHFAAKSTTINADTTTDSSAPKSGAAAPTQSGAIAPRKSAASEPPQPTPAVSAAGTGTKVPATVADRVRHILVHQLQIDGKDIRPDSDIETDLGGDPMDKQEIVMQLETEYNIKIPDADVLKLHTVGDFIAYIQRRTSAP